MTNSESPHHTLSGFLMLIDPKPSWYTDCVSVCGDLALSHDCTLILINRGPACDVILYRKYGGLL